MINLKLIFFILIILAVILVLILGMIIYFIGSVFWAVSLKYEIMSKAISVFTILNLLIIALVGVLVLKKIYL